MIKSMLFLCFLLFAGIWAQRPEHTGKSECEIARQKALKSNVVGKLIPNCDPSGDYSALQCHFQSKFCQCWRSDGTPITQPSNKIKSCECLIAKDDAQKLISPSGLPKRGQKLVRIPQCNASGGFEKKQCDTSLNLCWCVNQKGEQVSKNKARSISCP